MPSIVITLSYTTTCMLYCSRKRRVILYCSVKSVHSTMPHVIPIRFWYTQHAAGIQIHRLATLIFVCKMFIDGVNVFFLFYRNTEISQMSKLYSTNGDQRSVYSLWYHQSFLLILSVSQFWWKFLLAKNKNITNYSHFSRNYFLFHAI